MKKVLLLPIILTLLILLTACSSTAQNEQSAETGAAETTESLENNDSMEISSPESEGELMEYRFEEIPDAYFQEDSQAGSLERIEYTTLDRSGAVIQKEAQVYLPYGYSDTENLNRQYNILYLMHGGSGSENSWFGSEKNRTPLKNIIDQMIQNGEIEPLIIVTPSYYTNPKNGYAADGQETLFFQTELTTDLIPAVEGSYRVFADSTDAAALEASRSHRAFGGYSMGSVTTWYVFTHHLDSFRYFMPMSGDSWELGTMGGSNYPEETASALAKSVQESGYSPDDYFIYCSVGEAGMAFEGVTAMMEGLKTQPNFFIFTDISDRGNIHFDSVPGYQHDYPYGWHYIYNSLPAFFKD